MLREIFVICVVFSIDVNCRDYMKEKPAFFKMCASDDVHFETCYAENFENLVRNFKDGVPGLPSVGSLDPVKIKKLKVEQNQLRVEMKNVTARGLSTVKLRNVTYDEKDFSSNIMGYIPKFLVNATYATQGKILFLTLNGKGKMWVEMDNLEFVLKIKTKLQDDADSGLTFADIQSSKMQLTKIGNVRINLDNLFNGQKELEDSTNAIFNQNWEDIMSIMRSPLEKAVDSVLLNRLRKIFAYMPAHYLISNVPKEKDVYGTTEKSS